MGSACSRSGSAYWMRMPLQLLLSCCWMPAGAQLGRGSEPHLLPRPAPPRGAGCRRCRHTGFTLSPPQALQTSWSHAPTHPPSVSGRRLCAAWLPAPPAVHRLRRPLLPRHCAVVPCTRTPPRCPWLLCSPDRVCGAGRAGPADRAAGAYRPVVCGFQRPPDHPISGAQAGRLLCLPSTRGVEIQRRWHQPAGHRRVERSRASGAQARALFLSPDVPPVAGCAA